MAGAAGGCARRIKARRMTARVLFVVPTYNRARDLPRTLGAIAAQDWPSDCISILVVDNASTDDTPAVLADLARHLPCAIEHLRKAPEGPTVARNIGLKRGQDRLVALVDSDVELDPGWTRAAVAAMAADPALAMVGSKLVFGHDPTLLNSYGGAMGFLGLSWDRGEGDAAATATAPRDVLWANSSALLVRPQPALAVGGFDESFFMTSEEPDLGLRLAIAGWRARVVPGAVARHHVDIAIGPMHGEMIFHITKNRIRMALKVWALPRLVAFVALYGGFSLVDVVLRAPRVPRLRALWWNVVHLGETWHLRRATQALRRVADHDVAALLDRAWFPPNRLRGLRRRPVRGSIAAEGADDRITTGPRQ